MKSHDQSCSVQIARDVCWWEVYEVKSHGQSCSVQIARDVCW